MRKGLTGFVILAMLSVFGFAKEFSVDQSHTSVGFSVTHLMISEVDGNFKEFSGDFDFDPKTDSFKSLSATIDASSIDTSNEKRDAHLRDPDFFDVKKYPDITFKMLSYKADGDKGTMVGELTIKDVTKEVTLETNIKGTAIDPWGNERVGFELEGEIDRKEFGLNWNKALETGGVLVGDTVELSIKIQGKAK
ncbi:MAG: YceI family protein [Campylobacterales bacterium]